MAIALLVCIALVCDVSHSLDVYSCDVVSTTGPERSYLRFASQPLCTVCTVARPDKPVRVDGSFQQALRRQPLEVAATSRWLRTLSVSCPMQRLEMSPPALGPAAELSCRIHGMARMRSCDSSRFAAVMRCISAAPAARSQVWLALAVCGARAAPSRDDTVVERQAWQVTNGPHMRWPH